MAAVKPLAEQLDIPDIAGAIASDPGATAALGASFLELTGGTLTGDLTVEGTVVGEKDNATSLRVRGPNHPDEGSIDVQSYSGIFYNTAFAGTGTLKTRAIHGANLEMDLELQGPHQVRLAAVDDTQTDGQIFATSKTNFVFNMRADAEVGSPAQLIVDRVSKASTGTANTSDVEISVSSGTLHIASALALDSTLDVTGDVGFSGTLDLPAGSAAAPALTLAGDTNTGVWWSGPDTLDLTTGGINRMRLESDGTLSAQTPSYETLVTSDQDMVNKKYVDDELSAHTGDATIHFTEASISHLNIQDIGANSHADIDAHISDGSIHRELDDGSTTATNLWSASKIQGELDAKVDVAGDTMTGNLTLEADLILDNTATTQLFLANGTLVDPALAFQTDTDTGLWWPGADTLELVTGSTGRLRIDSTGLLTVGTASYETLVTGGGDDAVPNRKWVSDNHLSSSGGSVGGTVTITSGDLNVAAGDIDLDGRLDLVAGTAAAPTLFFTGSSGTGLWSSGADTVNVATAGSDRLSIDSIGDVTVSGGDVVLSTGALVLTSGDLTVGGDALLSSGTAFAPSLSFTGDADTGMWRSGANTLDFTTAGTNRFQIEDDGTLNVQTVSYETLVTSDDDIPNKKYVDDEIAAADYVPIVDPAPIALLAPTPKAALGPLGAGAAIHLPGSMAMVTDDGGPTTFVLAVVADGPPHPGPTWVRADDFTTLIT